ncbi:MAG: hypothetical protein DRH11_16765 [Deltaproteobacteria bacterium]|nr:MAG: hypothetical protein DRH11_16765 [Deltaproteobacteria bacterium]
MKARHVLVIVLYSLFFTFIYHYHVTDMDRFQHVKQILELGQDEALAYLGSGWSTPRIVEGTRVISPIGKDAIIRFYLRQKDAFTISIQTKEGRIDNGAMSARLNGHPLCVAYEKKREHGQKVYYKIPAASVRLGENELNLTFRELPFESISFDRIKLRNYVGYTKKLLKGAIIFDDSPLRKASPLTSWRGFISLIVLFSCIYLLLALGSQFASKHLQVDYSAAYRNGLLSFVPGVFLFSVVFLASSLTPYHVAFDVWSFLLLSLCLALFSWSLLLLRAPLSETLQPVNPFMLKCKAWIRGRDKRFLFSSKTYIIGFMVLIISCAFLLVFKAQNAAEEVANVAYFFLVIGVGIEVYRTIRYRGREDDKGTG